MDANGYTSVGVVSPAHGQQTGQPEVLAEAKRGNLDPAVVSNKRTLDTIIGLLDGTRPSARAAAEKEPWSSTARNRCTLSEEKAMPALCAARTQILCQLVKKTDTS